LNERYYKRDQYFERYDHEPQLCAFYMVQFFQCFYFISYFQELGKDRNQLFKIPFVIKKTISYRCPIQNCPKIVKQLGKHFQSGDHSMKVESILYKEMMKKGKQPEFVIETQKEGGDNEDDNDGNRDRDVEDRVGMDAKEDADGGNVKNDDDGFDMGGTDDDGELPYKNFEAKPGPSHERSTTKHRRQVIKHDDDGFDMDEMGDDGEHPYKNFEAKPGPSHERSTTKHRRRVIKHDDDGSDMDEMDDDGELQYKNFEAKPGPYHERSTTKHRRQVIKHDDSEDEEDPEPAVKYEKHKKTHMPEELKHKLHEVFKSEIQKKAVDIDCVREKMDKNQELMDEMMELYGTGDEKVTRKRIYDHIRGIFRYK